MFHSPNRPEDRAGVADWLNNLGGTELGQGLLPLVSSKLSAYRAFDLGTLDNGNHLLLVEFLVGSPKIKIGQKDTKEEDTFFIGDPTAERLGSLTLTRARQMLHDLDAKLISGDTPPAVKVLRARFG